MMASHTKYNILLVDDEENLRNIIELNLNQEGYNVITAKNGKEALDIFIKEKHRLHLALLDVSMPKMNGFELCEKIKSIDKNFPVFFLTVRNDRDDKIYGLKLGADDYLTKPFDLEELLLRIKKLLERYYATDEIIINNRKVNFNTMTVELPDKSVFALSVREAALLQYFFNNKNKVLSRQQILEAIWADKAEEASYRTIDNFVVLYRKLFEDDPKNPRYFLSVRGIGYTFKD
ncbi:MAG: response regulator transcription factor [Bacteroidia bacterium]